MRLWQRAAGEGGSSATWEPLPGAPALSMAAGSGAVTAVALSNDGSLLAAASRSGPTYIYDVGVPGSGSPAPTLRDRQPAPTGPAQWVTSLAFSPDDTTLALGGSGGDVTLLPMGANGSSTTGAIRLDGHPGGVSALAWSPATGSFRRLVVSSASAAAVRVWLFAGSLEPSSTELDFSEGDVGLSLDGENAAGVVVRGAGALAWRPGDGAWLAAAAGGKLRLWNMALASPVRGPSIPMLDATAAASPDSLAWAPDGGAIALSGPGDAVALLRLDGVAPGSAALGTPRLPPERLVASAPRATPLAWAPDGSVLAAGGALWTDLAAGSVRQAALAAAAPRPWTTAWGVAALEGAIRGVSWSADGASLMSAAFRDVGVAANMTVRRWAVPRRLDATAPREEGAAWTTAAQTGDPHAAMDGVLAVASDGLTLRLTSAGGAAQTEIPLADTLADSLGATVTSVALSADATRAAMALSDSPTARLGIVSLADASLSWYDAPGGSDAPVVGLSRDGAHAALAAGSSVTLWALPGGDRTVLLGAQTAVLALDFSPNGSRLAAGGLDGALAVWGTERGELVMAHQGAGDSHVMALALSPGGRLLAAGGADGELRIHDLALPAGAVPQRLSGHTGGASALAFAPGLADTDARLASGSLVGELRLWDIGFGSFIQRLDGALAQLAPQRRELDEAGVAELGRPFLEWADVHQLLLSRKETVD